jgi:uncharacterized membrane protein YgdD (TMEM256/DUF423 family)
MRAWLTAASANGFIAVGMGAYAAHGASITLDEVRLNWLETAIHYQMWHALALIAVALLMRHGIARGSLAVAAVGFLAGTVLFSGSLYLLALAGVRGFAWATPFGGAALLVGWVALAVHGLLRRSANPHAS